MIAVDTNILVYAHREDSAFHDEAYAVIRDLAEGSSAWAIPWPCIHEFLAIVTHPRIYARATPLAAAMRQVNAWMESPTLRLLAEHADYWPRLQQVLSSARVTGSQVHDARIAAICLENGITELLTADRDFGRFRALRVRNPLA